MRYRAERWYAHVEPPATRNNILEIAAPVHRVLASASRCL
jgi:hypothetical protein